MFAGLDGLDRGVATQRTVDDVNILASQETDEIRRICLTEHFELERALHIFDRALDREVDHESEEDRPENRPHDQRGSKRAAVPQIVDDLLDEDSQYGAHQSSATRCMARTKASSRLSHPVRSRIPSAESLMATWPLAMMQMSSHSAATSCMT